MDRWPDYPMIRGGNAFVIWPSDEQVLKAMTEESRSMFGSVEPFFSNCT